MFGSRFLDKHSTDFEKVYSFGKGDSSASFMLVQPVRRSCSYGAQVDLSLCTHAQKVIFVLLSRVSHYAHGGCINVFGTSDGMSVAAFRTALPIGGLSCFAILWNHGRFGEIEISHLCNV